MRFFYVAIALLLAACSSMPSHKHSRGTVVTLDSPGEAHVCLGSSEVRTGDRLKVFKSACSRETRDGGDRPKSRVVCEKNLVGEVEVIENNGEHFSKVKTVGDLTLEEGLIVEKQN